MTMNYFINNPCNVIPFNKTKHVLWSSQAFEFHKSLKDYQPTPLYDLPNMARQYGVANIYIKDESIRFGLNAFKGLGASYAIDQLILNNQNIKTFCTATDGNHGRAVAWYSKLSGKKSVVVVPEDTTRSRILAIEAEGASVIQISGNFDEACAYAEKLSQNKAYQLVQDAGWEGYEEIPNLIMAGYLTLYKELESSLHSLQNPKIDIVFLQAGVGSFAGSAVWYYLNRYGKNRPKIVIVEPFESDGLLESFKNGKRENTKGNNQTIMAGLNCGIPSLNVWEILQNAVDVVLRIEDRYAEEAMKKLYNPEGSDKQIISGESGAAGLAGFIAIKQNIDYSALLKYLNINKNTSILFFNTEGATDQNSFDSIIG